MVTDDLVGPETTMLVPKKSFIANGIAIAKTLMVSFSYNLENKTIVLHTHSSKNIPVVSQMKMSPPGLFPSPRFSKTSLEN